MTCILKEVVEAETECILNKREYLVKQCASHIHLHFV